MTLQSGKKKKVVNSSKAYIETDKDDFCKRMQWMYEDDEKIKKQNKKKYEKY